MSSLIEKQLYHFCGETEKYIKDSVFLSCYRLLAGIGFSFLFAKLLTDILEANWTTNLFLVIGGMIVIILIKQWCMRMVASKLGFLVSEVKENLRKAIYQKVLRLGISYQESFQTQEVIHLAVDGVEQLENYFGGYLTQFYYCFASSLILFCVIAPWNLKAALVLLIMACSIPLTLQLLLKIVKKVQKKYWSKYASVGNLFLDSLQGLTTLKVYGTDGKREEEIADLSEGFRKQTMKVLKMQLSSIAVINWIAYGGTVAAIIISILAYRRGDLGLFGLLFIFMLAPEFFIPMRTLTAQFHVAMTGVAAAENMMNFLQKEEEKSLGEESYQKGSQIHVKNLVYHYQDGTKALDGLNLDLESGKLTAIVGHSGCGKSTFASLLSGEMQVGVHQIFVGDTDIRSLKAGEITKHILRITHDGHIFSGTVKENLLMGNPEASEEMMIEALEKVSMWKFLQEKDGLNTVLLSQGKNVSGGQAQRISLARALLHNAEIYIFDEANSNVDIESEEIILSVIYELAKTKTVVYISHRLPSIRKADTIYVMRKGKVVQSGNHESLYAEEGLYQSMYREQEDLENFQKGGSHETK